MCFRTIQFFHSVLPFSSSIDQGDQNYRVFQRKCDITDEEKSLACAKRLHERVLTSEPGRFTVVGGSLFGAMESMEKFAKQKYCILSATQNRPSDLMKHHLARSLPLTGTWRRALVKRVDGSEMPFLTNSFQSDKKINTMVVGVLQCNPPQTNPTPHSQSPEEKGMEIPLPFPLGKTTHTRDGRVVGAFPDPAA